MARTKDEQLHAQRRDGILQAAARTFKTKGFHSARTEDICVEAGLSAGTVFRHFASKHEMIMEIVAREFARYQGEIRQLASREGLEWLSQVDAAGLAATLAPSGYNLGADSWLELQRDPEWRQKVLAFDRGLRETLVAELELGQREGWVRAALDPVGAANLILAMFSGLDFDRDTGVDIDMPATARALADFCRTFIFA
ncbi:TetR/AcrR family transcriptional regulator [Cupriavidus basilensis]|uniref:TetR/AcrR family transcriptional regulator n=1 Tax=Cupriavidus basilensis TaxID=68895 RepID=A0ABT6AXZ8_9BURK|nr:TetR/AcrR family transcriptional regulator [Cupriavidus basilensis]MDF3837501.1 TetR/AcrR family transcriptional regulator [Cupriavidus basilensis]